MSAETSPVFISADSLRLHKRASQVPIEKKPEWLKVRATQGPNYRDLKTLKQGLSLHTICEEAHCPNIYECWENRTATFLILGRICTRACRFCAVETGRPTGLDLEEPKRVAEAVKQLRLRHVVITSVARDDLADGGACVFGETIRTIRSEVPECAVEVLIPDLQGSEDGLAEIVAARPDILNHNLETVARLQRRVRAKARYERSLWVLRRTKELDPSIRTKSGLMLGVGERQDEVVQTMSDLGLVGLAVSLALLTAWGIAAGRALGLGRRARGTPWTPERVGLAALAASAIAFGVQSVIDWTWFVPGPAVMALAAAGFVAGSARPDRKWADRPSLKQLPRARLAMAAAALLMVGVVAWAAWQPQRSHDRAQEAYRLLGDDKADAAERSAADAEDINPLSLEPLFARAAVLEQKGDLKGAEARLNEAVREHRSDPASWLRLAQFQLFTLDDPKRAQETLLGALALDPNSREAAYAYFETRVRLRGGQPPATPTQAPASPATP